MRHYAADPERRKHAILLTWIVEPLDHMWRKLQQLEFQDNFLMGLHRSDLNVFIEVFIKFRFSGQDFIQDGLRYNIS